MRLELNEEERLALVAAISGQMNLLHLKVYAASYTRDREAEKRREALRDRLHTLSGVLARVSRPGRRAK